MLIWKGWLFAWQVGCTVSGTYLSLMYVIYGPRGPRLLSNICKVAEKDIRSLLGRRPTGSPHPRQQSHTRCPLADRCSRRPRSYSCGCDTRSRRRHSDRTRCAGRGRRDRGSLSDSGNWCRGKGGDGSCGKRLCRGKHVLHCETIGYASATYCSNCEFHRAPGSRFVTSG